MTRVSVAVLGATGLVGQRFIQLLDGHPWFEVAGLAASERSVRKPYRVAARWRLDGGMPEGLSEMVVANPEPREFKDVPLVFSALPSDVAGPIEERFARAGKIVVSNAASHRMDPYVPVMNPEANADHLSLIEEQRIHMGWDGAIVTNPNCTTAVLTLSLKPLMDGFGLRRVLVSSMQAISGAGYPGVAALDIVDNVIPYIAKEEDKVEVETRKILGPKGGLADFKVSASCHRVSTIDGHLEAVFAETVEGAEPGEAVKAFESFRGEPQRLRLPTAPEKPILVRYEEDRPQPRLDRMEGRGMSVVVGRVRRDHALEGLKYIVLGHNTIRGAAGCAVLIGELLHAKGYI
ncbi:MAG: aspartate-semialdehyde dehydrogenase [Candidatus Bathyarchaeia archaeon]|nr:aspartate-semialdehyde dehydrogenase [Candidatus Bathyarchaeota archaeon]